MLLLLVVIWKMSHCLVTVVAVAVMDLVVAVVMVVLLWMQDDDCNDELRDYNDSCCFCG